MDARTMFTRLIALAIGVLMIVFVSGCASRTDREIAAHKQCSDKLKSLALFKKIGQKLIQDADDYDLRLLLLEEKADQKFINNLFAYRDREQECNKFLIAASSRWPAAQFVVLETMRRYDQIYLNLITQKMNFADANKAILDTQKWSSHRMDEVVATHAAILNQQSTSSALQQFNTQQQLFKTYAPPQQRIRTTTCSYVGGFLTCNTF